MEEIKYCKRCHRKLKDEYSKKLGYGSTCYKKIQKRQKTYLFEMEVNNEKSTNGF